MTISSEQIGIAIGDGQIAAYRAQKTAIDRGFLINNETRPAQTLRLGCGAARRRRLTSICFRTPTLSLGKDGPRECGQIRSAKVRLFHCFKLFQTG